MGDKCPLPFLPIDFARRDKVFKTERRRRIEYDIVAILFNG
jgi:hypothetical protein